jgi:Glycosyltransferase family 87
LLTVRLRSADPSLLYAGVLLAAVASLVLFGIVGIGRPGDGGFDMAFLYAAGRTWLNGLNAYVLAQREAGVGPFAFNIYAFAYPPPVFPLAVALGSFSFSTAKLLMLMLNLMSAVALSAYCVKMAEPSVSSSTSSGAPYGDAYRWVIPAIIVGNPFTAHVLWMGQTTLIVAASIAWGCRFAHQNRWILGGLLLAVSTIKPQFSVFAFLWLAIQQRWRPILTAGAISLLFALGPLLISGPTVAIRSWLEDIKVYQAYPSNTVGFEHSFGLQSVLYHLGIAVPTLALIVLAFAVTIFFVRAKIREDDILPLLLSAALLLSVAHDYDLVLAAPMVPALWRHLRDSDRRRTAGALLIMSVMFLPQRVLKPFDSPVLLQFRVVVLLGLVIWLFVLSAKDAKKQDLQAAPAVPG